MNQQEKQQAQGVEVPAEEQLDLAELGDDTQPEGVADTLADGEESPGDSGMDAVLADLEGVDVGEDPAADAPETAPAGDRAALQAVQQAREAAAQATAAVAAATVRHGLQTFVSGVAFTDRQQQEFAEKLAPVLAKHGGTMPPWLAELLANWREELDLARFLAVTGYLAWQQHKQATPKARVRVPAGMQEA